VEACTRIGTTKGRPQDFETKRWKFASPDEGVRGYMEDLFCTIGLVLHIRLVLDESLGVG
jgi:hypothetical protein